MDAHSKHHDKLNKLCSLYGISYSIFVFTCFDIDLFNDMYFPTPNSPTGAVLCFIILLFFCLNSLTARAQTIPTGSAPDWNGPIRSCTAADDMQCNKLPNQSSIQASWNKHNISAVVAAKDLAATV